MVTPEIPAVAADLVAACAGAVVVAQLPAIPAELVAIQPHFPSIKPSFPSVPAPVVAVGLFHTRPQGGFGSYDLSPKLTIQAQGEDRPDQSQHQATHWFLSEMGGASRYRVTL
jgi:hypothetical protein